MSEQPYRRPPITEAIIEIRYAAPIEPVHLERGDVDFRPNYPFQQPTVNYGVAVGVSASTGNEPVTQVNRSDGRRLSSMDQTELILLWPQSFIVAQLAPYPGWDNFFGRFARDWKTWKRGVGYRKVARVGVRFINRIDIPQVNRVIEEADYLNAYAKLPDEFGPVIAYGVQAQFLPDDKGCRLTLNSASVPSPLLDHGSVLLDLDVGVETNPPQNDEDIYTLLNEMRAKKNAAFEACVTHRARELFQR